MAKTIQYIPSVCKTTTDNKTKEVIKPTFTGSVTLRKLTFDEKYDLMEAIGVEVSQDKDGEAVVKTPEGKDTLALTRKLVKASLSHYEAIDLTRLEDGERFTSVDDLETDEDGHVILMEVSNKLFSGFRLGNG